MSDKQITVAFSEEKYKVLDFFLKRENQSIEAILLEQLENVCQSSAETDERLCQFPNDGRTDCK